MYIVCELKILAQRTQPMTVKMANFHQLDPYSILICVDLFLKMSHTPCQVPKQAHCKSLYGSEPHRQMLMRLRATII